MMSQLNAIRAKIHDWATIVQTIAHWRAQGYTIVFTNGCFDILHYGHLHYLAEARDLGDKLVIGLNTAASVQRLKGPHRPIHDEMTRQHLLAALTCVDAVVPFETDTPLELIRLVQPDLLVKGGDWQPEQIVGSDIVLARGGQVQCLPYIEGYSTTAIEQQIRSW
ncbi:MAG TPA: D-glycero-beta-D-manno-heptose 1-phosphate adenylyltransferase [Saprospiraceae bacterium]|nr:D-glycero-beta-D-manno-heptose 1-phosphate adenylyltransferase [Saprospiraceae bacterium]HMP13316.1 D-glycero-beta-D-manno-heptose 1-phosphate adenylyltransferase [Saprospiraceae bacterium]